MSKALKKILSLTSKEKENGIYLSEDGEIFKWGIDNVPHNFTGEYKEWYDTNILFSHFFYKNGKKNGIFITYHVNGNIDRQAYYIKGMLWGDVKHFDSNGRLLCHRVYRNNILVTQIFPK